MQDFAEDHYMFYQCYDCKKPYFTGARACGAQVRVLFIHFQNNFNCEMPLDSPLEFGCFVTVEEEASSTSRMRRKW